ncbi:threonine synthase [Lacihabitans soyangensis]|uniref:Threonine synthase n=1 Tax=Lacihabitans soyangensis TaxID=869394 RepID=A0AAE3GZC9_9BACT|nr:threonine synthase [Lacihabitans soyangensis]MCP9761435.1 threonine synthase [Lacihabitans soyangensis]
MQLYSTNRISENVGFEEAIFRGLPPDNGLYMPLNIPKLPQSFWDNIENLSLNEIAFEICSGLIGDDIPKDDLKTLIDQAIDFEAPVVPIKENIYCLELFHGSSMAFKDFGARFMAAVMSYFLKKSQKSINILVATSGDTGGAVAQGFFDKENISVTILYPAGKVSDIQEKQLTTLGKNIKALEIDGTFDDCQALVKQAFLDNDLRGKFNLASANSINIARLIPQSFYYVAAYAALKKNGKKMVFSVPSGNFGNLTAGLLAIKMGMPNTTFIAATNINKVVPEYLESGVYSPISPSKSTISNAMDVGNPSNFPRMRALFGDSLSDMKGYVKGCYFDDNQTRDGIKELYEDYGYLTCPHSAIGYLGLKEFMDKNSSDDSLGVFLSTAHYAKFLPEMESTLGFLPEIPERLESLLSKTKVAVSMANDFEDFKSYLNENLI